MIYTATNITYKVGNMLMYVFSIFVLKKPNTNHLNIMFAVQDILFHISIF
jgi:hypothetical protein